jgi:membrane fusion protein (multidrug efflux system)
MENNPIEAVRNNALATRTLTGIAGECGVASFVLVSTDKAVAPATVMGASKALAEWAFPGQTFAGEVYAIDPLVDEGGRSILLRARLPNPDHVLRPGLFARVTLVLNEREGAIQIPEQALVPQGQDQFVFKVADGKAAFTKVTTGIRREGMVEITDGLGPEDEVVTAGQLKLRDGGAVEPVPAAEA